MISASLSTEALPTPARVEVTPAINVLRVGWTQQLVARAYDAGGNEIPGVTFSWASTNTTVARVSSTGLLTGRAGGGPVTIRATTTNTTTAVQGSAQVVVPANTSVLAANGYAGLQAHACTLDGAGRTWCWGSGGWEQLGIPKYGYGGVWDDGWAFKMPVPTRTTGSATLVSLVAGSRHTCGLDATGAAYCWGTNDDGQVGQGTYGMNTMISTPTAVQTALRFESLAFLGPRAAYTCGLVAGGDAYCWGLNDHGSLGDGTALAYDRQTTPAKVVGGLAFVSLAAGGRHTCGLTAAGAAYCWGYNESGALGNGTTSTGTTSSPQPVAQGTLRFAQLALGWDRSCAITTTGATYCWGDWGGGSWSGTVPSVMPGAIAFQQVRVGEAYACGLDFGGEAYCIGSNGGQFGDGTTTDRFDAFMKTSGGLRFRSLATSAGSTCGRTLTGVTYCWGQNHLGQLGDGTFTTRLVPTKVLPLVASVVVTPSSSKILVGGKVQLTARAYDTSGRLVQVPFTWTSSDAGKLTVSSAGLATGVAPGEGLQITARVGTITTSVTVAVRQIASVQLTAVDSSLIVGDRLRLRLAVTDNMGDAWLNPTPTWKSSTTSVATVSSTGLVTAVRPGSVIVSATFGGVVGGITITNAGWAQVDAMEANACGLTTAGEILCVGPNDFGQLGTGDPAAPVSYVRPSLVGGGHLWSSVTAGFNAACGIRVDGTALCWGTNQNGELGLGTASLRVDIPTPVGSIGQSWKAISLIHRHACGLGQDGTAYCWGNNGSGRLGLGYSSNSDIPSPQPVSGGLTFSTIEAGGCGIASGTAAHCWGYNGLGAVGAGTFAPEYPSPTQVIGSTSWRQIASGITHACGISTAGALYCWGDNLAGAIGTSAPCLVPTAGACAFSSPTPVTLYTATWNKVKVETHATCGLTSSGALYCWGYGPAAAAGTWKDVGVGYNWRCAIKVSDSGLYCWGGSNDSKGIGPATAPTRIGRVLGP